MERHFLGLVLTLLPEGVLAIVCHHFVLETGLELNSTDADIAVSPWKRIQSKVIVKSYPLASRVVRFPFLNADGFGHIVADWKGPTMKNKQNTFFSRNRSHLW